jgi:hypothetical protein
VGLAADAASDAKRAEVAARREAQEEAKRGSSKSSNKSKDEKAAAVIEAGERLRVTEQELAQVQSPDLAAGLDACRAEFNPHSVAAFKAMSKMVRAALKSARSKAGAAGSVFVDANSSVSYSSALGFRLAVDGLDNFPASSIKYSGIYVLASPLPQGLLYSSSGVLQSDVTYYSHLSYTSKTTNPRLADGYKAYCPAAAGGGIGNSNSSMPLYLILDVRCLATAYTLKGVILGGKCKSLPQPKALALGFSLLPALVMGQRGRRFTASGNYRLPVYQTGGGSWARDPTRPFDELSWEQLCNVRGGPPTEVLDMLGGGITAASTVTPTPSATPSGDLPDHPSSLLLEVLQRAEAQGLICRVRGVSLVCRLVDGSRQGQFEVAFGEESEELSRVITQCLPPGTSAEYAKAQPPHSKATTISNSIEGLNAGSTDAHREQAFQTFLSISTLTPPTNTLSQL